METASALTGVAWEIHFFLHAFWLGFCLRMGYDGLLLLRRILKHSRFFVSLEDLFFWLVGSVMMFGLLFRENNGTPRLFALVGLILGMSMYHLGPSRIVCGLFDKGLGIGKRCGKIFGENVREVLQKRKKAVRIKKKIQIHKE
ncbi:MAG: spore cortex biosynthesis protein YabQ [Lachnospiraceae bacterium]|nr:spore cortex biosynthesis protein YabQ [Lachnospiraceae bacterium]